MKLDLPSTRRKEELINVDSRELAPSDADIDWTRNAKNKANGSGARIATHLSGVENIGT